MSVTTDERHDLASELVLGDLELDLPEANGAGVLRGYTTGTCAGIYCSPA